MDVELEAVGRKIGELRAAQGLRLADLAQATGYTTSYLSQIERGTSIPSLTALATVAVALGVEMTALVEDHSRSTVTIVRADEGKEFRVAGGNSWRTITRFGRERPYSGQTLRPPGGAAPYRHFGERFIFVLDGELTLTFGDDTHHVGRHGSIHYGAHEDHVVTTDPDTEVDMFIVSRPALF